MPPMTVPIELEPQSYKIMLEDIRVLVDIGLHDFEIGRPQRLLVNIEVWLDEAHFPRADAGQHVWDYDFIRDLVHSLAAEGRFNLQETLCRAIYAGIAARPGVKALRVSTRKPDVYPDSKAVGVELSSLSEYR